MTSLALADLLAVGSISPVPAVVPWLGLVAGTLLALVGLVSLVQVLPRMRRARRTTGTVVEVNLERPARSERMWRPVLEYPGETPGGPVRRGEWVGESTTDLTVYEPGMRLPLRYDPVTGTVVDLPGGGRPPAWLLATCLLVVGTLVAVGTLAAYR